MLRLTGLALAVCLLACKTTYVPEVYPLRDGLIPPLDVSGTVSIRNDQPSMERFVVWEQMGNELSTTLSAITETMTRQAATELAANTRIVRAGPAKTVGLKVTHLRSKDEGMGYFYRSSITFEVKLGEAEPYDQTVQHSSGLLLQDLNGCIAEGVMGLFLDARMQSYLKQDGAP